MEFTRAAVLPEQLSCPYISPCIITMHVVDLFVRINILNLIIVFEGVLPILLGGIQHLEAPILFLRVWVFGWLRPNRV